MIEIALPPDIQRHADHLLATWDGRAERLYHPAMRPLCEWLERHQQPRLLAVDPASSRTAVNLAHTAACAFRDEVLRDTSGLPAPVPLDDDDRLEFMREMIHWRLQGRWALEGTDPLVQVVRLESSLGRVAGLVVAVTVVPETLAPCFTWSGLAAPGEAGLEASAERRDHVLSVAQWERWPRERRLAWWRDPVRVAPAPPPAGERWTRGQRALIVTGRQLVLLQALLDRPGARVATTREWLEAAEPLARFQGWTGPIAGLAGTVGRMPAAWVRRTKRGGRVMAVLTERGRAIVQGGVPLHVVGRVLGPGAADEEETGDE